MLFPTLEFAVFFLVVLTLRWAICRTQWTQKVFLLAASYGFYAAASWRFLVVLVLTSVANYILAERIARSRQRGWLAVGIVGNLFVLGAFKYYHLFRELASGAAALLRLDAHLPILQVALPLGISFTTFQVLAYLIDLHRGHAVRAQRPVDFLLFIAFFPQLLAGPICRSRDLLPQILGEAPNRVPDLSRAASLIASGLCKKMVLATYLATNIVDDAFGSPESFGSAELLIGVYAYTALIYCDFSGYMDMARGFALLLGFRLPRNFFSPLAATSIGDFWRRWHVTFSSWLRDYVYIPLGGSRVPWWRCYLNIMVTFLIGGLWHGAHLKFVVWGAVHGLALTLQKAWRDLRRAAGRPIPAQPGWVWLLLGWLYTFHLCALARILFRCPDLATAWEYSSRLVELSPGVRPIEPLVVVAILIAVGLNFVGKPLRRLFIAWHERVPAVLQPVAWVTIGVLLLALKPAGLAPYVYLQF